MHEQAHAKGSQPLSKAHMKLLADFLIAHFGDFSRLAPKAETISFQEIIPETPAEVAQSDHWMRGVEQAVKESKNP